MQAAEGAWFGKVVFNIKFKVSPCGGIIFGPEGIITSPSYPDNYPPTMDCAWLVQLPDGQIISVSRLRWKLKKKKTAVDFVVKFFFLAHIFGGGVGTFLWWLCYCQKRTYVWVTSHRPVLWQLQLRFFRLQHPLDSVWKFILVHWIPLEL